MVLPDSDGISRVPPYSGYTPEVILFRLQGCYLLWLNFPVRFVLSITLYLHVVCPSTPESKLSCLLFFCFALSYLENRICFLFLWVLRCFSSPGLPRLFYRFK